MRQSSIGPGRAGAVFFYIFLLRLLWLYTRFIKFPAIAKHRRIIDDCLPFLANGCRLFNSLEYFFTLCGVPVAEDSYWSSRRMHAIATHMQILQPIKNKRPLFLDNKISTVQDKFKTTPSPFLGLDLHDISKRARTISWDCPFKIRGCAKIPRPTTWQGGGKRWCQHLAPAPRTQVSPSGPQQCRNQQSRQPQEMSSFHFGQSDKWMNGYWLVITLPATSASSTGGSCSYFNDDIYVSLLLC